LKDRNEDEDIEDEKKIISPLLKRTTPNTCLNDKYFGTILGFSIFSFDSIEASSFTLHGKVAAKNFISTQGCSITNVNGINDSSLKYCIYTDKLILGNWGCTINGGIHYGTELVRTGSATINGQISNDPKDNLPYDFNEIELTMNKISEELFKLSTNAIVRIIKLY